MEFTEIFILTFEILRRIVDFNIFKAYGDMNPEFLDRLFATTDVFGDTGEMDFRVRKVRGFVTETRIIKCLV